MGNINSLKEFLEVYESTGDEFFICGEQYDPHLISSSMCSSFKPTDANNFISEFLELEKYSLCDDIDYDYDAEDSEHYVNEVPDHVYIDAQEPDLGVCRIYDFFAGGDSILECPSMNSISTWTRNIISELCAFEDYEDLELNDITFDIVKKEFDEFGLYEKEKIESGFNPLNMVPEDLLEIAKEPSSRMDLIKFNSLIFNERFGFGGIVNYFLKAPKELTCSTMMGATEHANTPQSDKTYIGINKHSNLVEYVRVPFSLSN